MHPSGLIWPELSKTGNTYTDRSKLHYTQKNKQKKTLPDLLNHEKKNLFQKQEAPQADSKQIIEIFV